MQPPQAPKHPYQHRLHNDVRNDDYYWLRDKENPEVIAHLEAENAYFDSVMAPLRPFEDTLFDEMRHRLPDSEETPAAQSGPFFYYRRIEPDTEYPRYFRRRAQNRSELASQPEELLLDVNALAKEGQFTHVSTVLISPNHRYLAYLENHDGTDRYTIHIKDLSSGNLIDEPIRNVFIGDSLAWDSRSQHLFYLTVDASQRPSSLHRHRLGTSAHEDVTLYREEDITFSLSLSTSLSGRYLFLSADTNTQSEVRYLPANDPEANWQVFQPRRAGIRYHLEHWRNFLINVTNEGAENFTVKAVSADHPDPAKQDDLIPYDSGRYLEDVLPFHDALILVGREGGLTQIWRYDGGLLERLQWQSPLYTVTPGPNFDYHAPEVLIRFQSLTIPKHDYAVHLRTGEKSLVLEEPVRNFDASQYMEKQIWARAEDGTAIPVSLAATKETWNAGRPAPLILYGYGSYGAPSNPTFDATRLPLLDRGAIYAIAHVRGGSEMGYNWYLDGKFLKKRNTFTDFIAVAQHLIDQDYTTPKMLAARGRSAGGLLMGAILNLHPELFQVVVAGVPFVDVVTTMLDASLPLTSLEWDEWGNPADPVYYEYMKSYSPYDNVSSKPYPHIMVYTGLNDPRVGYFEPAKWVARLRELKTDSHQLILKTHMGAGHGGSSGRFAHLKELAEEYAFILDKLGISH
ncbi:S9 family peptidase [Sulfobacillus harzensis]|uniref:S9 family peptidase n=1 Tax=Sulfobacillus harzensis TaxID=2729629 RepID=A0A7Y0Q1X6_9FIRM|nr:S9 family peptidase [Sulfobacillus harzensis]NMP21301.1 S9 family peptidase [Sulfobacillus harzensis]